MKYNVLGVGFPSNDYGIEKQKWAKYGACFEFVDTIQRAITLIRLKQFKCIVVCSAQINEEDLTLLRRNSLASLRQSKFFQLITEMRMQKI